MIIKLIVVKQPGGPMEDTFWVAGAWDEYTIDDNPEGFESDVKKTEKQVGAANVRLLDVVIPEGALGKPFQHPVVVGEVQHEQPH